jgi:AcrR family transcriptional regulator
MGVQERRAREKKELRQEILDAAREMFVRDGFENVSMRKIAEKIEYSPTTIYLYFQDKADLLDCLCEETFTKLVKKQSILDQSISDPLERLQKSLKSYVEFGLKHPNHYKVTFMMPPPIDEPRRGVRSGELGKKAFAHLRDTLALCSQHRLLEIPDLEATAQTMWAAVHGLTSLLIAHPKFEWVDRNRLIDTMVEMLTSGLKPPRPTLVP